MKIQWLLFSILWLCTPGNQVLTAQSFPPDPPKLVKVRFIITWNGSALPDPDPGSLTGFRDWSIKVGTFFRAYSVKKTQIDLELPEGTLPLSVSTERAFCNPRNNTLGYFVPCGRISLGDVEISEGAIIHRNIELAPTSLQLHGEIPSKTWNLNIEEISTAPKKHYYSVSLLKDKIIDLQLPPGYYHFFAEYAYPGLGLIKKKIGEWAVRP